ncbi:uncharacterized protein ASPGLDRAFT_42903 [Aspergillus glaucus CBS 516.65]|uniref:Uncharacterized protein n=1 Tax=Aspergillus glaucus CBS 516.65 TaxID=1160497 RepID=A0A1L9VVA7_ASPGL|nr:hypothetical protein ASPGLDRAFT_42903 [Aspergillus glaucus CBS 516.65]OJJ87840.1 hypothetical protein ASPGLDRAFT_42903 [Aspergillus glaucus CBS 516.65]
MRTLIGNISYLLLGRDILGPEPIWRIASTGAKSILMPLVRLALKAIPYLDFEVEQILIRSDLHDTTYEDNKKGHDPMPSIPLQKPLEKSVRSRSRDGFLLRLPCSPSTTPLSPSTSACVSSSPAHNLQQPPAYRGPLLPQTKVRAATSTIQ